MHSLQAARKQLRAVRRRVTTPSRRLALLAPAGISIPRIFHGVREDGHGHRALLSEIQRFRGRVYLDDHAIDYTSLIDGRHILPADDYSWHLLLQDESGRISGCLRYQAHELGSLRSSLCVLKASIATSPTWGPTVREAVASDMKLASSQDLSFVEVGGWAIAGHVRGTSGALRMALAAYSLGRLLGGALGVSTATRRHCSSSILRRIGGKPLEYAGIAIPPYFDPEYDCDMEILRFDSANPNPRYSVWVEEIGRSLRRVPVITNSDRVLATAAG